MGPSQNGNKNAMLKAPELRFSTKRDKLWSIEQPPSMSN
jgi:hypothetical protein